MRLLRIAVTILMLVLGAPAMAQPCNPVIDGTYCAEFSARRPDLAPSRLGAMRNIGNDIVSGQDQPATLGAITFGGSGSRCIGLLRRGSCN
jgi:hypothetical protein